MFLSQLILNLKNRKVIQELADRYELHRTIMSGFPHVFGSGLERVLFRVEATQSTTATILVQSQTEPQWDKAGNLNMHGYLHSEPRVRLINPKIQTGNPIRFRLQANPTIKRENKRHAIYKDADLLAWLERKGNQRGFEIAPLNLRINQLGKYFGKNQQQTWHAVQFDGILTVTDVSAFEQALIEGIGSAKGLGFGMLSIPYA